MEKVCSEHVESIAVVDRHRGHRHDVEMKITVDSVDENIDFLDKTGSRNSKKGCKSSPFARIICQNTNIPSDLIHGNHNTTEMV